MGVVRMGAAGRWRGLTLIADSGELAAGSTACQLAVGDEDEGGVFQLEGRIYQHGAFADPELTVSFQVNGALVADQGVELQLESGGTTSPVLLSHATPLIARAKTSWVAARATIFARGGVVTHFEGECLRWVASTPAVTLCQFGGALNNSVPVTTIELNAATGAYGAGSRWRLYRVAA